jgi:glycosyltransferase involved in cell wall biosynthesis
MKVSVVIATHNQAGTLENTLSALFAQQTDTPFEVVVVDDKSCDETRQVCSKYESTGNFIYVRTEENNGPSKSRNIGVSRSSGDVLAFTDSDCVPTAHWISEIIRNIGRNDVAGMAGPVIYQQRFMDFTISDRVVEQVFEDDLQAGFLTANIAYRRHIFERVGGFNESFMAGEDIDLALRVLNLNEGKIVFNPEQIVFHKMDKNSWLNPKIFKNAEGFGHILEMSHGNQAFKKLFYWNIFLPKDLLIVLCPPILILTRPIKSVGDLLMVPWIYLSKVYERVVIWRTAIRMKKVVI